MKKLFYLAGFVTVLSSCGGKGGPQKDAEAVCDCMKKTKGTSSMEEKFKCLELQRQSGEKYLNSPEDLKAFNDVLTPCITEYLGQ